MKRVQTPWVQPTRKRDGSSTLKKVSWNVDRTQLEAIKLLAAREAARYGTPIPATTVLVNLIFQAGKFWDKKRTELRQLHRQLNKENQHVKDNKEEPDPNLF